MRVAIVFSGLVRGDYDKNIEAWTEIAPCADFYFTSWEDAEYEWLDATFPVPHVPYWPSRLWYERDKEKPEKAITHYKCRHRSKKWVYQQMAHALAIEKFDLINKYDVIVRARYDIPLNMTSAEFDMFCGLAMNDAVIALGVSDGDKILYDAGKQMKGSPDFGFIAASHTYVPDFVYAMVTKKKLLGQETGWAQSYVGYKKYWQAFNYIHDKSYTV